MLQADKNTLLALSLMCLILGTGVKGISQSISTYHLQLNLNWMSSSDLLISTSGIQPGGGFLLGKELNIAESPLFLTIALKGNFNYGGKIAHQYAADHFINTALIIPADTFPAGSITSLQINSLSSPIGIKAVFNPGGYSETLWYVHPYISPLNIRYNLKGSVLSPDSLRQDGLKARKESNRYTPYWGICTGILWKPFGSSSYIDLSIGYSGSFGDYLNSSSSLYFPPNGGAAFGNRSKESTNQIFLKVGISIGDYSVCF